MIKHVKFAAAAVLGLSAVVGLSGQALAGISATKHNLSTSGTGNIKSDNPEICVFCHTPHDAIKNNNITLWNHQLSSVTGYGVYTSPTFVAGDIADVAPVAATAATATATNLCLSCHDGTVALNSMNNPSNQVASTTMSGSNQTAGKLTNPNSMLGADLTNDHPVNFTYDTARATADGSLVNPVDAAGSGLGGAVKLYSGKVQCASCHDPHTSAQTSFLRASMSGSGLCLACHSK